MTVEQVHRISKLNIAAIFAAMARYEKIRRWRAMTKIRKALSTLGFGGTLSVAFILSACDQKVETQRGAENARGVEQSAAPASIPMGGSKSVTRFFVTSKGLGKGGDLGGLAG